MVKDKESLKKEILNKLSKNVGLKSLHMTKLSGELGASIPTVSKYCHILEAEGKVVIEEIGKSKIVKLK